MKKKNARVLRWVKIVTPIVLVLCLLVAGLVFFLNYEPYNKVSIAEDPEAQLLKSLQKTQAVLEQGLAFRIPEAFWQSFKTGSIEASLKTEDDTTIASTLYLRENAFAMNGTVTQGKNEPDRFALYADKENIAVDVPAVLENTVYGLQPLALKEDLKDSALLEVLQLDYEEVAKAIDAMLAMQPAEDAQQHGKDWQALLEMKARMETLLGQCAVGVEEGNIHTDLGEVKVYRVSYTMTPAQMCSAMDLLVDWTLQTDAYKTAMEGVEEDTTASIKAEVEELKKQIVATNATTLLNIYLHGKTQIITQTELRIDWFEEENKPATFRAVINLGADPIQSLKYTADFSLKLPDEFTETVSIVYERSHAHNLPGRRLLFISDNEEYTVFEMQVNQVTNAFTLEAFDKTISVTGTCKSENDKVYLSLDLDPGTLALTFTATAQAPQMPQFTNICKVPEMKLLELFIAYLPERTAELIVEMADGTYIDGDYIWHYTCSIGQMLADNGFTLSADGKLLSMEGYEPPVESIDPSWEVYIDGEKITGNLFEICTDYENEIVIRDIAEYPEEN